MMELEVINDAAWVPVMLNGAGVSEKDTRSGAP